MLAATSEGVHTATLYSHSCSLPSVGQKKLPAEALLAAAQVSHSTSISSTPNQKRGGAYEAAECGTTAKHTESSAAADLVPAQVCEWREASGSNALFASHEAAADVTQGCESAELDANAESLYQVYGGAEGISRCTAGAHENASERTK